MRDEELVDLGINARRQVRADGKNTAGHCVLTCDYIAERFELMKIPYHTVVGFFQTDKRRIKHVWIMLEDGRILDPTADQFNSWLEEPMPDVYLGNSERYTITKVFDERMLLVQRDH